jgi:hypothetical protein
VKKAIVLSMAVALLLQAACGTQATPTQEPTPIATPTAVLASSAEQILGTWLGRGVDGLYHLFREDGICHVAVSEEKLADKPDAVSAYWFEGTQLFLKHLESPGLPDCPEEPAIYEVQLLANGSLRFRKVKDTCAPRARSMQVEHTPVS